MLPKRFSRFARQLNLTDNEFQEFTNRLSRFYLKREPTQKNVMEGFFILSLIIQKRELSKPPTKFNFDNIKHIQLKKYASEIMDLKHQGFGATRASKFIKTHHHAEISKSTIEKFWRQNNG